MSNTDRSRQKTVNHTPVYKAGAEFENEALICEELSGTPDTPPSGYRKVYARNGTIYELAPDGTETDIGTARYTDEEAQDAVGTMADGSLYYDDVTPNFGIADGGVSSVKIADGAVGSAKISSGAVGSSEIADGSITTTELGFDTATQTELNNHAGTAGAHHTRYSDEEAQDAVGAALTTAFSYDDTNNTIDENVVTSGTATLSSGVATISTGLGSAVNIDVYLDPSGGGNNASDVKASARAFWDNSASEIKVEILEDGTNVGNPDIGYRVVRA